MQNACINNLRQIDAAKQQWALENGKNNGVTFQRLKISNRISKMALSPTCPAGGTYTIGAVSERPTCSIPGHKLPQLTDELVH